MGLQSIPGGYAGGPHLGLKTSRKSSTRTTLTPPACLSSDARAGTSCPKARRKKDPGYRPGWGISPFKPPPPLDSRFPSSFHVGSGSPRHKSGGAGSAPRLVSENHSLIILNERKYHPEITQDSVPWKPE